MKKLLVALSMMIGLASYAQESSKNSFGVTAGAGSATVARASLEGGPGMDLERDYEFGLSYYRQIGAKVKFETGIFYHYNRLTETPAFRPDVPQIANQYDIHLIYLPLFLRINLSKHFFVNGGGLVDIDMSNSLDISSSRMLNSQSGIGAGLGVGSEFSAFNKLYLQLNPFLNLHGAILMQREDYPGRILDAGIKLGIRTR